MAETTICRGGGGGGAAYQKKLLNLDARKCYPSDILSENFRQFFV